MKTELVGKKSAYRLFVETVREAEGKGQRLLDAGWFTATDLAKDLGWSVDKADGYLRRHQIPKEKGLDPRTGRSAVFYKPQK